MLALQLRCRLSTQRIALAAVNGANKEATSTNKQSSAKSKESEEAAAEDAEIARLKDKLAEAQNQLEWQLRELVLDQHNHFFEPQLHSLSYWSG